MSISKKETALIIGSALFGMLAIAGTAMAAGPMMPKSEHRGPADNLTRPEIIGTVSAVNGDILTVASNAWEERRAMMPASTTPANTSTKVSTVYTVDATNATVFKNNATSTLSSIAVGDNVMIAGTVSGTNIVAKTIREMPAQALGNGMGKPGQEKKGDGILSGITGNGQPIIGGNITAINGSTLTVTNKGSASYNVDATSATIMKNNATSTLSSIAVGDSVVIQGTVNGTAITASSVIDQGVASSTKAVGTGVVHKVMGAIGGFFTRVFGFF